MVVGAGCREGVSAKAAIGRMWRIVPVSVSARNRLAQPGTVECAGIAASRWENADSSSQTA